MSLNKDTQLGARRSIHSVDYDRFLRHDRPAAGFFLFAMKSAVMFERAAHLTGFLLFAIYCIVLVPHETIDLAFDQIRPNNKLDFLFHSILKSQRLIPENQLTGS